jgi:preprotein translocase subunit YajC
MSALQPLLLVVVFVAIFYFLAVRPQRRRAQEARSLQANLKPGDEVVTVAGIYGTVTEVEEGGTILLEVSENTDIRIANSAIARVIPSGASDSGAQGTTGTTPAAE